MSLIENFEIHYKNIFKNKGYLKNSIMNYSEGSLVMNYEKDFDILKINWLKKQNVKFQPSKDFKPYYESSLVVKFKDGEIRNEALVDFSEEDDFILHLKKYYPEIFII